MTPALAGRPGNFAIISLVAVLAMTMTVSALATYFREEVRNTGDAGDITLARLQALYLAEMGINEAFFRANRSPAAGSPAATPTTIDLKREVAMVRDDPAGEAQVVIGPAAPQPGRPALEARATLRCKQGLFTRTVYFDAGRSASTPPQWTLTRYVIAEGEGAP